MQKSNLLIFLTPYIVRNSEDFREIFNRKMAERREFIERWTAFEYHRVDPHLDWTRTSGVVSEINRVVTEAQEEEALRLESELSTDVSHTPKDPIYMPGSVKEKENSAESDDSGEAGEATREKAAEEAQPPKTMVFDRPAEETPP